MTTFRDKFDRADYILGTADDWSIHTDTNELGVVAVDGQQAQSATAGEPVLAAQVGTDFDTGGQIIRAGIIFNSSADDTNAQIAIGHGFYETAIDSIDIGVSVLFDLEFGVMALCVTPAGTVGLTLDKTSWQANQVALAFLTNVFTGSNYNTRHDVELWTEPVASGLRCRVWVDKGVGTTPDFDIIVPRDRLTNFGGATPPRGYFFFGAHTTQYALGLSHFEEETIELAVADPPDSIADSPTLGYIVSAAREVYERSTSTPDLETSVVRQYARRAHRDILNSLSQDVSFLRREERMTLAFDGDGYCTLPKRVRLALKIARTSTWDHPLRFHLADYRESGRLRIRTFDRAGGNYYVRYLQNWQDPQDDADRFAIPWRYEELLVTGTAMRMSLNGPNEKMTRSLLAEYGRLLNQCKRKENQLIAQENETMTVGVAVPEYQPYGNYWQGYGG